jgi:hypothetical protein
MVVPRLVRQKVSQPVPDGCSQVGWTEGGQPWYLMVGPRLVGQKVSQPIPDGCAQGFGYGSGSARIRINLSCWIRIRKFNAAKNDPQK